MRMPIRLDPACLLAASYLIYLCKNPISKYRHVLRFGGQDFNTGIREPGLHLEQQF